MDETSNVEQILENIRAMVENGDLTTAAVVAVAVLVAWGLRKLPAATLDLVKVFVAKLAGALKKPTNDNDPDLT